MAAVGVAEAAGAVVVLGEEEGGVGAGGGVLKEHAVDRGEKTLGRFKSDADLTAKIGLQIGHEERGGDAFSGDVADDEREAVAAEIEEVVVVSADVAGLDADAGVVEGLEHGQGLGEELGLDLLGDLELLGGAAFGLELIGDGSALGFNFLAQMI